MLKIFSNHNKEDIVVSFSIGQAFPKVEGKLLRIEINGAELEKLIEAKEIPLYQSIVGKPVKTIYLVWNGKQCGSTLKTLQELFDK